MSTYPAFRKPPAGLLTSVQAGLSAGLLVGALHGLCDGLVAGCVGTANLSAWDWIGCLGSAVGLYVALWIAALSVLAVVLHPLLRTRLRELTRRYLALVALGFMAVLFVELYWWSRPWVFYGRPASSPERLASAAGMLIVCALFGWWLARWFTRLPAMLMRSISIFAALAIVLGFVHHAMEDAATPRGQIQDRNRDQPNILFIVVDALRQDTLGCYGDPRVKTPNIDRLATEGVLFENHFTQVPFTWPSFGSMLTGKYPRRHGLVKMEPGLRMPPNITLPWHLKTGERLDGRAMEDSDWVTASFHTGTLSTGSGLLRGFDEYFEAMVGHDLVRLDSTWSVFRSDLLLFVFKNKFEARFDSAIVASNARDWLEQHHDKRFATMVHLYSTHTPYDPPADLREQYLDPAYKGPIQAFYSVQREAIEAGRYTPTPEDVQRIRDLYYAGVAHADRMIGELVETLRAKGVLDSTLVIVTSDHGESLGEDGLWEHDHMVQTNLRIPLVMRWPKGLPAGRRVAALTDSIDLLPTVCELVNMRLPVEESDVRAFGEIDGRSLMSLVRGESVSVREHSFAENAYFHAAQNGRFKLLVDARAWQEPTLVAARAVKDRFLPRLYELTSDPHEQRNVLEAHPQEAEALFQALRRWNEGLPVRRMEESHRDLEMKARFQQLGYTGGDEQAPPKAPR